MKHCVRTLTAMLLVAASRSTTGVAEAPVSIEDAVTAFRAVLS